MLPIRVAIEQQPAAYPHQYGEDKPLAVANNEAEQFVHFGTPAIGLADKEAETVDVFQSHASTLSHTQQRIFCNVELDTDLVDQSFVETAEECATTSQIYTVAYNVGIQFRGCLLKSAQHSCLNFGDCFLDTVADFLIAYRNFEGQSGHEVGAVHDVIFRGILKFSEGRTYVHLNLLGGADTDLDIMCATHVIQDVVGEVITCNLDTPRKSFAQHAFNLGVRESVINYILGPPEL